MAEIDTEKLYYKFKSFYDNGKYEEARIFLNEKNDERLFRRIPQEEFINMYKYCNNTINEISNKIIVAIAVPEEKLKKIQSEGMIQ